MEAEQIYGIIEALLFASGDSVEISALAQVLEVSPEEVQGYIHGMQRQYREQRRGIMIRELDDKVQLCSVPDYYPWLIRLVTQPKKTVLTGAVLETLSIIAYKQPVTRAEIEKIRGVSCDHAVTKLMDFGLIEEKGRLDAPGRPILFGTTEEFLRCFNVSSIEDLPSADDVAVEKLRQEAEAEAGA